ncbi:MAG: 2-oxo acid dehydrogenase subunit E2 [Planctomycetota bacterium]|nr:2-oxo acid dehydrogenase subunit E2 [Planctomycetota bacterium]
MPRLSDTMENGTVIKWNVKKGDEVSPGDVLADIETDKATMELQSFEQGKVAKLILDEGQSAPVGSTILVLAEADEDLEKAAEEGGNGGGEAKAESGKQDKDEDGEKQRKGEDRKQPREDDSAEEDRDSSKRPEKQEQRSESKSGNGRAATEDRQPRERRNGAAGGERVFASPLARKIAEEKGLDLASISGSGPSGRIIVADVEAAASGGGTATKEAPSRGGAAPAPALLFEGGLERQRVALSNMRRTIATRLVESNTTIPPSQVTITATLDNLMARRKQLNDQLSSQGVKLSVNDFLVRACAVAMHQHPFVNSRWSEEGGEAALEIQDEVNVGVAIALPAERGGGLVVATLRNADRKGLRQISQDTRTLAEKARTRGLSIEEMSDSTFTISNLGMYGVEHFTAIINPPNVAILAVGAAMERPVIRDGQVVVASEMSMTMSSDHRVIDGAMAAEYLNTVKRLLENPATLLV